MKDIYILYIKIYIIIYITFYQCGHKISFLADLWEEKLQIIERDLRIWNTLLYYETWTTEAKSFTSVESSSRHFSNSNSPP